MPSPSTEVPRAIGRREKRRRGENEEETKEEERRGEESRGEERCGVSLKVSSDAYS